MLLGHMQSLAKEIGAIGVLGDEMKSFKQDFENFFNSPKLRGNLGEAILKDLLEQVLPKENFAFQHSFKDGQIVDAIIKTDKGLIAIDSKFPMDDFRRFSKETNENLKEQHYRKFIKAVKKHIKDISQKYILPQEKTLDFALMYLPSESIYYEILVHCEELQEFSREYRILLVSPNSFYYFLKVILLGLEGKKVEQKTKSIIELLNALNKDIKTFGGTLSTLNKHVTNAKNTMDNVTHEYRGLEEKVTKVKYLK